MSKNIGEGEKNLSNDDRYNEELYRKTMNKCFWSGVKGGVIASAATGILLASAPRFVPAMKTLNTQVKLATVLIAGIGTGVICAEHTLFYQNRPFLLYHREQALKGASWSEWLFEKRYHVFAGSLAAGVIGGAAYLSTDKTKNTVQKIMNIRLATQMVGFMALAATIGAGIIASQEKSNRKE